MMANTVVSPREIRTSDCNTLGPRFARDALRWASLRSAGRCAGGGAKRCLPARRRRASLRVSEANAPTRRRKPPRLFQQDAGPFDLLRAQRVEKRRQETIDQ